MTDGEIIEFLKIADNDIFMNWSGTLEKLRDQADDCNKRLCRIAFVNIQRGMEDKEGKRTIPFKTLLSDYEKFFDAEKENTVLDNFGEARLFNNDAAAICLKNILSPNFKPIRELNHLRRYSLAIKKGFDLLSKESAIFSKELHPSIKVLLRLWDILTNIDSDVNEQWEYILKKEEQREQNRTNATITPKKLSKIKLNPRYEKIEKILEVYEGTKEQNKQLDSIIKKILRAASENTVRRYRGLILNELQ